MTPEGRVSAALRQAVINAGGEVRKLMWQGRIGAPDWFIAIAGRVVLIEAKAKGERPRRSQLVEFKRISAASGIPVLVVDTAADAIAAVRAFVDCGDLSEWDFGRFL